MKPTRLAFAAAIMLSACLALCVRLEDAHYKTVGLSWPRWQPNNGLRVYFPCEDNGPELEFIWCRRGEGPTRSDIFSAEDGWRGINW